VIFPSFLDPFSLIGRTFGLSRGFPGFGRVFGFPPDFGDFWGPPVLGHFGDPTPTPPPEIFGIRGSRNFWELPPGLDFGDPEFWDPTPDFGFLAISPISGVLEGFPGILDFCHFRRFLEVFGGPGRGGKIPVFGPPKSPRADPTFIAPGKPF